MRETLPVQRLFLAPLAFFVMVIFADEVSAQHLNWSFAAHPHPDIAALTDDELTAVETVESQEASPGTFCQRALQVDFSIYKSRYPSFSKFGDKHTRMSTWKTHIVTGAYRSTSLCVIDDLYIKLIQSTSTVKSNLVFCGVYSRAPETPEERQFADYMDELVDYAQLESPDAISSLLAANPFEPLISLNPDVEYFLRKPLEQSGEHEIRWGTGNVKPLMENTRVEFLDEAVKNRDFKTVLQTTPPCTVH